MDASARTVETLDAFERFEFDEHFLSFLGRKNNAGFKTHIVAQAFLHRNHDVPGLDGMHNLLEAGRLARELISIGNKVRLSKAIFANTENAALFDAFG